MSTAEALLKKVNDAQVALANARADYETADTTRSNSVPVFKSNYSRNATGGKAPSDAECEREARACPEYQALCTKTLAAYRARELAQAAYDGLFREYIFLVGTK